MKKKKKVKVYKKVNRDKFLNKAISTRTQVVLDKRKSKLNIKPLDWGEEQADEKQVQQEDSITY